MFEGAKDYLEATFNAISALAAVGALCYAVIQVSATKRLARESDALQAHREYLSLCLEHPGLSSSLLFAKNQKIRSFDEIDTMLSPETEAYLWFLSIVLNTCEQILENVAAKGPWRRILHNQLRIHWPALEKMWPKWENAYGGRLRRLMAEVLALGPETDWTEYARTRQSVPDKISL
ncbi:hypothetical protein [Rhizobium phaseoli]|uniref:hypothetical protein n=1 Tax=Rhizobium phaseoli TaxID=396 RepID=UPI0007EAE3C2|nr:hypothetical protein [Rhizobium phaseoli]ANL38310.1 hypothetical protein AMC89_PD00852 [Rhizobium phaseoli]